MKSAKEIREMVKKVEEKYVKAEWEKLKKHIEDAAGEGWGGTKVIINYSQHVKELLKLGFTVEKEGGVNSTLYNVRWGKSN